MRAQRGLTFLTMCHEDDVMVWKKEESCNSFNDSPMFLFFLGETIIKVLSRTVFCIICILFEEDNAHYFVLFFLSMC